MKLAIPVAAIFFASGICCCGDFFSGIADGVREQMEAQTGVTTTAPESTETTTTTTTTTSSSSDGSLETVAGVCGPFKAMGVKAPSGFSVMVCSDQGPNSSLVLQGSGDPIEACKPLKSWVESQGFTVQVAAAMGGTSSIVAQKDGGARFVVACTNSTGQTLITYSLSASN